MQKTLRARPSALSRNKICVAEIESKQVDMPRIQHNDPDKTFPRLPRLPKALQDLIRLSNDIGYFVGIIKDLSVTFQSSAKTLQYISKTFQSFLSLI